MITFEDIEREHNAHRTGAALHYFTLYGTVYGLEAKKVFEFGSGFSSHVILKGLNPDGLLISCDVRPQIISCPEPHDDPRWKFVHKPSLDATEEMKEGPFDLVFHDGAHDEKTLAIDIENICPYIKQYGLLLAHDTQHSLLGDEMRAGLRTGLRRGLEAKGIPYSMVTFPFGYGLTIIRIEGNSHNGAVNITRKKKNSEGITVPWPV